MNTEQQHQVPINQPTQTDSRNKKRLFLIAAVVAITLLISLGAAYTLLKSSSSKPVPQTTNSTIDAKTSEQKDKIKLVKVAYNSTTPEGAQSTNDQPPVFANGSYLELNGNGELTYNRTIVKKDTRIKDAVLSRNGKHYAYRLELSPQNYGQIPTKSELYIDNNKVTDLSNSALLAVADNGKDYLVKTYTSKQTATTYNTSIREEVIKLNDAKSVVSSPYGFLSGKYSADLQDVLVQSRTNGAGASWYHNGQRLANCSEDTNNVTLVASLSNDGKSTLCSAYTLSSTQSGYSINKLQSFLNDVNVANIIKPIDADSIALTGFADKSNWMQFVGGKNVITSDGTVKKLSDVFPEVAAALDEPSCEDYSNLSDASIAFVSNTKLAVLVPCSSKKLFTKDFDFSTVPDLSKEKFLGLEYNSADATLYIYTN